MQKPESMKSLKAQNVLSRLSIHMQKSTLRLKPHKTTLRDQACPVNNDGSSGRSSERTFQELLQQQNDITKLLIDQHKKSPIPPCETGPS